MTERELPVSLSPETQEENIYDNPAEGALPEYIALLRLAYTEGAYQRQTNNRKRIQELRFIKGLSISQIAAEMNITKQAVSQSLKLAPKSLFRIMTRDFLVGNRVEGYSEILKTYAAYQATVSKKRTI